MKYILEYGEQHLYLVIIAILIMIISIRTNKEIIAFITIVITVSLLATPFFYPLFKYDERYVCEYKYVYKGSENYVLKTTYSFWSDTNDFVKNNETFERSKKVLDSVFKDIDDKTTSDDYFKTVVNNFDNYGSGVFKVRGSDGRNMRLHIYTCEIEKASK